MLKQWIIDHRLLGSLLAGFFIMSLRWEIEAELHKVFNTSEKSAELGRIIQSNINRPPQNCKKINN